jgi:Na+-driven multidrug efflux pump
MDDTSNEKQPVLAAGKEKLKYSALNVEDPLDTTPAEQEECEGEIFNLDDNSSTAEKVEMILVCSVPIIFTFLLSVFGTSIMMFFAGKLSKDLEESNIFAGVSLALTYCNISFLSIMEGFSSAVETLSSNYNGSKNYEAVGQTLHKSIASLSIVALPLLSSWFFIHKIFRMLGVSDDLCDIANSFLMARFVYLLTYLLTFVNHHRHIFISLPLTTSFDNC